MGLSQLKIQVYSHSVDVRVITNQQCLPHIACVLELASVSKAVYCAVSARSASLVVYSAYLYSTLLLLFIHAAACPYKVLLT